MLIGGQGSTLFWAGTDAYLMSGKADISIFVVELLKQLQSYKSERLLRCMENVRGFFHLPLLAEVSSSSFVQPR